MIGRTVDRGIGCPIKVIQVSNIMFISISNVVVDVDWTKSIAWSRFCADVIEWSILTGIIDSRWLVDFTMMRYDIVLYGDRYELLRDMV